MAKLIQNAVKEMKRTLIILLVTTSFGASFGVFFYLLGNSQSHLTLLTSIIFSVIIGSLMMLFIYLRNILIGSIKNQGLKIFLMTLLLIVAAVSGTELARFIHDKFVFFQDFQFMGEPSIYLFTIIIVLVIGLPIYQREEWQEDTKAKFEKQQFELLKLEQLKIVSELELLRAKVNPHFLYNVHNTIAGFIHFQPDKAEQMVLLLSKFFRYTLNKNSSTYHILQEEVDIVQTYLQIQQLRFGNRMQAKLNIPKEYLHEMVPSFIIQPLVENAVKHCIEKISSEGIIEINILKEGDNIIIRVADNGPPFGKDLTFGFGLQGIINKLNLLYRDNYKFNYQNTPQKYISLEFPTNIKD